MSRSIAGTPSGFYIVADGTDFKQIIHPGSKSSHIIWRSVGDFLSIRT
jgi:hypothetical protein